jgi:geranylgeranyl diphosphate synthase type I
VLAEAPADSVAALTAFGSWVGLAFQLVDDVLGIWGDPAVTGKPLHSDLRSRKASLPVAWAIGRGGATGAAVAKWLASAASDTEDTLREVAELLAGAGARDWAREQAARHAGQAAAALDGLAGDQRAVAELRGLAEFIVGRDQ